MTDDDAVVVRIPSALADLAGGRSLTFTPAPGDVAELLDVIADERPALSRRIRDETGALRRFPLRPGSEVHVLPSVAGG